MINEAMSEVNMQFAEKRIVHIQVMAFVDPVE